MGKYQKLVTAVVLVTATVPLLFRSLMADTTNVVPIPNGNQTVNASQPTPVDAIVTDSKGNMSEQQVTYNPATQSVTINNNYGGDNASVFLPLFEMGLMFWGGYWVGANGSYWNGSHYVHVTNVNWNQHWHNYWHNTWAPKWHHYHATHHNNPNSKFHNNGKQWEKNAGKWHQQYGKEGFNKQGFDREGFNREGFDHEGFNREGFNREGRDRGGFQREGGGLRGGGGGGRRR